MIRPIALLVMTFVLGACSLVRPVKLTPPKFSRPDARDFFEGPRKIRSVVLAGRYLSRDDLADILRRVIKAAESSK